ncbi:MAG: nucleotidyltransferase domain-containing protein [Thermofilum sp.]
MRSRKLFETRREVLEALERLARELGATVYLFGSYARGDHTLESDVDVVVVCERFEGMEYTDRVALVRLKLPRELGFDIAQRVQRESGARLLQGDIEILGRDQAVALRRERCRGAPPGEPRQLRPRGACTSARARSNPARSSGLLAVKLEIAPVGVLYRL